MDVRGNSIGVPILSQRRGCAMSKLTAQQFHGELESKSMEERMALLHRSFRNIPKEFIKEYLECDEEFLDMLVKQDNPEGVA